MSRSADALVLRLLAMRCDGLNASQIADQTGLTREFVRTATNRVRAADEAESGEDVAHAYWGGPTPLNRGKS